MKLVVDTEELTPAAEAARVMGIGYATLYRWVRDGKLIPIKMNRRTYVPKSEIERIRGQKLIPRNEVKLQKTEDSAPKEQLVLIKRAFITQKELQRLKNAGKG